jgi:hypothetical protein
MAGSFGGTPLEEVVRIVYESMTPEEQRALDEYVWRVTQPPNLMDEGIPIKGHYGTVTCHLIPVDAYKYRIEFANGFYRMGFANGGDYAFVDPSGGPFMHVGDPANEIHRRLPKKPIRAITKDEKGIYIEL